MYIQKDNSQVNFLLNVILLMDQILSNNIKTKMQYLYLLKEKNFPLK